MQTATFNSDHTTSQLLVYNSSATLLFNQQNSSIMGYTEPILHKEITPFPSLNTNYPYPYPILHQESFFSSRP